MNGRRRDGVPGEPPVISDAEAQELRRRISARQDISLEESRALERWDDLQPDPRTWFDKGPVRAFIRGTVTGRVRRDRVAMERIWLRSEELCARLVGMNLDDATDTARREGYQVREVSHRNGITAAHAICGMRALAVSAGGWAPLDRDHVMALRDARREGKMVT